MPLTPGTRLGTYEIVSLLGSGGMGEVYKAKDLKLGRDVAIKVLREDLASDPERLRRFEQEARAASSLNHPNIVTIHDIGEQDSTRYIAMEYVEGKTLREMLGGEPLPTKKLFKLSTQIADGLAKAHSAGIVHRDLKPENLMVSGDGFVKILDFGLAKLMPEPSEVDPEMATKTKETREGVVIGTVQYMSPEQAAGRPVDYHSDQFSFGSILYEMATGKLAFSQETVPETQAAIIRDEPEPVRVLNPKVPTQLTYVIGRCLEKEPQERYDSTRDLARELEGVVKLSTVPQAAVPTSRRSLEELKQEVQSDESLASAGPPRTTPTRWSKSLWQAGTVVGLFLIAWVIGVIPTANREPAVPRLTNPVHVTSTVGVENFPTWSADEGRLAYESNQSGNWDIWIAQVGGGDAVNLTADHTGPDRYPSWSPEGDQIAFLSHRNQTWSLYLMSALGGSPRKMQSLPGDDWSRRGAPQWSADGAEVAASARDSGLNFAEIVSLRTRESRRIPLPQCKAYCYDLSWSRDGQYFAYVDAVSLTAEITQLWIAPSSGSEPFPATDGSTNDWNPTWSADGRKLFFVSNRGGAMDLWQQRIGENGTPEGEPVPVTAGLEIRSAAFSPGETKLAYTRGRPVSNVWRVPILRDRPATWADALQLTFDNALAEYVDVSPDGKHLAISSDRAGNPDIWVLPSEGGSMTPLTTDPTGDWAPRWSPDGKEIAFHAYRSGNRDIWVVPSEGGPARQLTSHPSADGVPTWSPDGRQIAFASVRSGNPDVWTVGTEGGEAEQVTVHSADDHYPVWSPDGRWIVFQSLRGGSLSFWWIQATGGREPQPLSEGPGYNARWSPDGKVLYAAGRARDFLGWEQSTDNLWVLSLDDGSERPVTNLEGRNGTLGYGLATDGKFLYFTWEEDLGDIWVMDVVIEDQ